VALDYAALPRKRAVATMLLTDLADRVLVVKPTYKPDWELPGGAVEDGESPEVAAAREVVEELGLQHRRALAALRARHAGYALYLEDGVPF
jgi:8-oxo-dGTP pyrophosphatase MutT (NUDIX family)